MQSRPSNLSKKIESIIFSSNTSIFLLAIGIFLRLFLYLKNNALWQDEAWVAIEILTKSFKEIFVRLNESPNIAFPPGGFLLVEKFFSKLFGNSEYVLRLFPLASGILSLFLFYFLLKKISSPKAIPFSLGLFVLSDPLIHYSAELKQYSTDIMVTLLCYLYFFKLTKECNHINMRQIIIFILIGIIGMWFSYPFLFIIGAISMFLLANIIKNKTNINRYGLLSIIFIWWANFIIQYLMYYRKLSEQSGLRSVWNEYFLPLPIWSMESLTWLKINLLRIFNNPAGINFTVIAAIVFLIGCYQVFNKRKTDFFVLLLPIFLVLTASALKKYPFTGRVLLFAVPAILFFIGEGIVFFFNGKQYKSLIGFILFIIIFSQPLKQSFLNVINSKEKVDIRPVMKYLKLNHKKGDEIYYNNTAQYAVKYYSLRYSFGQSINIVGILSDKLKQDDEKFIYIYHIRRGFDSKVYSNANLVPGVINPEIHNINKLSGSKRTWILFTETSDEAESFVLKIFDNVGRKKSQFKGINSSVYLYDLS